MTQTWTLSRMKSQSDEETGVDTDNDNDKPVCLSETKRNLRTAPKIAWNQEGQGFPCGEGRELDLNVDDELIS